jgi:addiction module HigA family antidote
MQYDPDNYPHPGEALLIELEDIGLSQRAFAHYLGVKQEAIENVIRGVEPMSAVLACKISRALGGGPKKWIDMQVNHDLARVDIREYEDIVQLGTRELD